MNLTALKQQLATVNELNFVLANGTPVPPHFHVTEVGQVIKHFIDCGGTVRTEKAVNFQLWEAGEFDHRLAPQKLQTIIALSEKVLGIEEGEIEVEYQSDTIGKYGLEFDGARFVLTTKHTACLASDSCNTPKEKSRLNLGELQTAGNSCCTPGGGCC